MFDWLSQRLRNGPTREGWYYLALSGFIFAGAIVRDINLLLILSGLLLLPILANGAIAKRIVRRGMVRRRQATAIVVGESLPVQLDVSLATRGGSCWLSLQDELRRVDTQGKPIGKRLLTTPLPVLVDGQSGSTGYTVQRLPRGRYRFTGVRLATCYPWGLARRLQRLGVPGDVFVYPELGQLTEAWYEQRREYGRVAQRSQPRQGQGGEYYGLRDWRSGDSRRIIHWRASARHNTLLVRQAEQPRSPDLNLFVDLWLPAAPTTADKQAVETAIQFAATAVQDACRQGNARIVLGLVGRETAFLQGAASQRFFQEALELLATAEGNAVEHDTSIQEFSRRAALNGAPAWLVTTRLTTTATQGEPATWQRLTVGQPEFQQFFLAKSEQVGVTP